MRVLHLLGSLQPSGMERMLVSAVGSLNDAGIETIIVGQGENNPFEEELRQVGYKVFIIPRVRTIRGLAAWFELVVRLAPDVVHIHAEQAFSAAVIASRLASSRTPIIRTIHGLFAPKGRSLRSRRLQAFASDRFVARFVAPSPDVQDNERRFGRECDLVYNWVDDRFFHVGRARISRPTSLRSRLSAVLVGNASPIKNQELALEALEGLPIDLFFHGSEVDASPLEVAILDRLALAGRLLHRGMGDPAKSLSDADVFLLPSKHEGFSVALAEALTAGVPSIISPAPGLSWATAQPLVSVVGTDVDSWRTALGAVRARDRRDQTPEMPIIDFSARRGVREYLALYLSVTHQGMSAADD